MQIDADLDDVRLTVGPASHPAGALFFLPFALGGTLFFSIGLAFLAGTLPPLLRGQLIAVGPMLFMGSIFCFVGGAHAWVGWSNIAKTLFSLRAIIRSHSIEVRKRIGPVTSWRADIPLADLNQVACRGKHLVLETETHTHTVRVGAFDRAEVDKFAELLDEAAKSREGGEAPEELRRLVSQVEAV